MDAARNVVARFDLKSYTLSVRKTPVNPTLGTVTSSPGGLNCGPQCANASASYASGTVVTLTAQAIASATFSGWSGDCSGSGACVLNMDGDKSVTADFAPQTLGRTASSPGGLEEAGGERDVGLMRSTLKVRGGRGEVTVNGRTLLVAAEGEAYATVRARPGQNLIEAWVREDPGGGGLWRFDFVQAAFGAGGLSPLSGELVAITPDSITFRLAGRPGERVSFVLRLPARDEGP
jgi:hypothetical protein